MAKAVEYIYRVFNEMSGEYVKNYSTGTHIWTRRRDAEFRCRHNPANKVHKFKLTLVEEEE